MKAIKLAAKNELLENGSDDHSSWSNWSVELFTYENETFRRGFSAIQSNTAEAVSMNNDTTQFNETSEDKFKKILKEINLLNQKIKRSRIS